MGQAPEHGGQAGQQDGPGPQGAGLDERVSQRIALLLTLFHELYQEDGVARGDPGQGDDADHGSGREVHGVAVPSDLLADEQVQDPEARHDADDREGQGHQLDGGQQEALGLVQQQDVDAHDRHGKGSTQVTEDPQRHLPFALARPVHAEARKAGLVFDLVFQGQDGLGRRQARGVAKDVDHGPEVLVIDGLVDAGLGETPQLRQQHGLAGRAPDRELLQLAGLGPPLAR